MFTTTYNGTEYTFNTQAQLDSFIKQMAKYQAVLVKSNKAGEATGRVVKKAVVKTAQLGYATGEVSFEFGSGFFKGLFD
jgi:hypothetical protein